MVQIDGERLLRSLADLRSFGADPECVRALACAMVGGQRAGGVFSTAKHYPGLGDAAVDPHDSMARITRSPNNAPGADRWGDAGEGQVGHRDATRRQLEALGYER